MKIKLQAQQSLLKKKKFDKSKKVALDIVTDLCKYYRSESSVMCSRNVIINISTHSLKQLFISKDTIMHFLFFHVLLYPLIYVTLISNLFLKVLLSLLATFHSFAMQLARSLWHSEERIVNYTGGGGKSSKSQNPTQSSESKSSWMARKCKPPQAFLAASQASASFVVTGVFL